MQSSRVDTVVHAPVINQNPMQDSIMLLKELMGVMAPLLQPQQQQQVQTPQIIMDQMQSMQVSNAKFQSAVLDNTLDMMEQFRPLIADSSVINAINNKIVSPKDFINSGNAFNLKDLAKRSPKHKTRSPQATSNSSPTPETSSSGVSLSNKKPPGARTGK